jgi:two-component system invasion response regulator UvrY
MNALLSPSPATCAGHANFRLWIFEDHQCFRELLAEYLGALPGIAIAGTAEDEEQLYAAIDAGKVDLVILDLHLHGAGGFHVMERVRQRQNPPPVLILSGQATFHSLAMAVRLGAVGYMQKTAPLEELVPALAAIRAGRSYFGDGAPREFALRVSPAARTAFLAELSQREVDIMTRLVHGATAKELAAEWNISRFTIYKARTQILRKIGARNQQELVAYALRNGLLDPALVR